MNPEDKQRILDHLRLKKLPKQAFGRLCDGKARDILGLISEIFLGEPDAAGFARTFYLPFVLQDRLGMDHRGTLPEAKREKWKSKDLLSLNDTAKLPLEDFAAIIEDCF